LARDEFDAAVIGAGLGGLACACLLADQGFRVVLCERSDHAGGCQSCFDLAGVRFNTALAFMDGVEGLDVGETLARLGMQGELEFINLRPFGRLAGPGYSIELSGGATQVTDAIAASFPGSRAEVESFLARGSNFLDAFLRLRSGALDPQGRAEMAWFLAQPYTQAIAAAFSSPALRALFINQPFFMIGAERSVNAAFPVSRLVKAMRDDYYICRGGVQNLADALCRRFASLGGTIHFGAPVERIIVSGGRAAGVVAGGREFSAGAVISDIDARTTFLELLSGQPLPAELLRGLGEWRVEGSAFIVYCVLAGRGGVPPYISYTGQAGVDGFEPYAGVELFSPSRYDPGICPPDREALMIQAYDDGATWVAADPAQYQAQKDQVMRRLIALADRVWPGISGRVTAAAAATPVTLWKRTGNSLGSYMGWACNPGNMSRVNLLATPVQGLHFCGHWAGPLAGFQGVFSYAAAAARLAARGLARRGAARG
jgi:phytoene dehydrogenase-like protein